MRDFVIRRHMENCPRCQERLVNMAQAQSLFVKSREVDVGPDLWTKVQADIETKKPVSRPRRDIRFFRWEWVLGAAGILFMAAVGFWFQARVMETGPAQSTARTTDSFEIEYINVGGVPAEPYVYQPGDSDMIFVWAEKSDQGGKP
jgi:hypothetical protein